MHPVNLPVSVVQSISAVNVGWSVDPLVDILHAISYIWWWHCNTKL